MMGFLLFLLWLIESVKSQNCPPEAPDFGARYWGGGPVCIDCPTGYCCPDEDTMIPSEAGFFNNKIGAFDNPCRRIGCRPKYYCPAVSGSMTICPEGRKCPNAEMDAPENCDEGFYCNELTSVDEDMVVCPQGFYCPEGTGLEWNGNYCDPGYYCPAGSSSSTSVVCPGGFYCPSGTGNPLRNVCARGYYCPEGSSIATQISCPVDFYCPAGSATPVPCKGGYLCEEGIASPSTRCPENYYCQDGVQIECPVDSVCPSGSAEPVLTLTLFFESDFFYPSLIGICSVLLTLSLVIIFFTIGVVICIKVLKQKGKLVGYKEFDKDIEMIEIKKKKMMKNEEGYFSLQKKFFEISFDDIKILEVVGEGGYSKVFKCNWVGKIVAIKIFESTSLTSNDVIEEFEREITIMSSVSHPNLLNFYGAALKLPKIGILMELAELGNLKQYVLDDANDSLKILEKIRILKEIALAMGYLNNRQIVHRDLKLENVLLTKDKTTKVIDFGLSRFIYAGEEKVSKLKGTESFLAPEIILGQDYDFKVDVYAYAILCWCFLNEDFNPYKNVSKGTSIDVQVANDRNFRPEIHSTNCKYISHFEKLMSRNWSEKPSFRQSFKEIAAAVRTIEKDVRNIVFKRNSKTSI